MLDIPLDFLHEPASHQPERLSFSTLKILVPRQMSLPKYLPLSFCLTVFLESFFLTFAQLHLNFCASEMIQSLSLSFLNFPTYSSTVRSKVTTKTIFYLAYSFKIYYFGGSCVLNFIPVAEAILAWLM